VACLAAMVFPGLGHLVLGRWGRGVLLALSLTAMFVLGLLMKGHIFTPIADVKLSYVYTILNMGMGLPYFFCLATGFGLAPQDAMQTAEYGNTFLAVTGALNLLAAMDAFDIAIGRKQ
jgi:TM2 domain-containing membrane protein YozV